MTAYEQQILNTEKYYSQAMSQAEFQDQENLSSFVLGDHVHEKIHNTILEGIDEA